MRKNMWTTMSIRPLDRRMRTHYQCLWGAKCGVPVLVFWNVRSSQSTQQFPVSADENGTILLSGFSSSVMNDLMEGNEFKNVIPWKIIRKIIDSDIYKDVIL
jgi:hypothetical protein